MANGNGQRRQVIVNGIPVVNNLNDAANYAVNSNKYEIITQSLYDSAAYPVTGAATLNFFQNPVGSGVSVISSPAPKSNEDTNMTAAGALPNMQAFVVTSIEVEFQPAVPAFSQGPAQFGVGAVASAINDTWKFRATGFLNFVIGAKPYLTEGPMMKFPASNDFEIAGAASDASTAAAAQATRIVFGKAVGPAYLLAPNNLLLIPLQNFSVSLNWATLQPVTTAARVFLRLMGQLLRSAQ